MTDEEKERKAAQTVQVTAERVLDTPKAMKREHPEMSLGSFLAIAISKITIPGQRVGDVLGSISDEHLEIALIEFWRVQD